MKAKYFDSDGYTELFAENFGNIFATATFAKKIFIQNDKALETGVVTGEIGQYSDSDGYSMVRWALCPNTLSCPFNVAAELQAGGSLTADTTYYYRITAFNALGETTGSVEVSALTTAANKTIKLTWGKVEGAEGYIIYRSTSQVYTNARRDVIEDPDTLEWTDTGQVSDPSSPYGWPGINTDFDLPIENTTAGEAPDYGTAPTLAAGDLTIGILQPGQMKALWLGVASTLSTLEDDNPRNAIITFPEA
jgi:hypothetical protein